MYVKNSRHAQDRSIIISHSRHDFVCSLQMKDFRKGKHTSTTFRSKSAPAFVGSVFSISNEYSAPHWTPDIITTLMWNVWLKLTPSYV